MQKVSVLDAEKKELLPCHPAKARKLLRLGKATIYNLRPFTIKLNYTVQESQTHSNKFKPQLVQ